MHLPIQLLTLSLLSLTTSLPLPSAPADLSDPTHSSTLARSTYLNPLSIKDLFGDGKSDRIALLSGWGINQENAIGKTEKSTQKPKRAIDFSNPVPVEDYDWTENKVSKENNAKDPVVQLGKSKSEEGGIGFGGDKGWRFFQDHSGGGPNREKRTEFKVDGGDIQEVGSGVGRDEGGDGKGWRFHAPRV